MCATTSTGSGAYGHRDAVKDRLVELGVGHIRNRLYSGNRGQIAFVRQLAASGIRLNAGISDPSNKGGTPEQLVALVAEQLPDACSSFEGANEWNLQGGRNWVSELRTHQSRLYRAAKANARTRNIPVVGPSLGMRKDYAALGDLSAMMDRGNIHLYTGGFSPGYRSDDQLAEERRVCGSKPVFVTETGWHNASRYTGTHNYTPENIAGIYAPRLVLEYFRRNVPRVFIYELVDDPANPAMNDHEAHFGLLRNDFSRKPAFTALANFQKLLDSPNASKGAGRSLTYGLTGATSDVRSVLVSRNDGTSVLFLWRDVAVWDVNTRRELVVKPATVTVNVGQRSSIRAYKPSTSNGALQSAASTSGMSLPITGEVWALEIRN
ncbi:MAG: hypothetical protein L0H96_15495 [Humibacillus sp.]|nr:hypothetical protein [Humibacillus sp.]